MDSPPDFTDAELVDAYIFANGVTGDDSCFWAVEELMNMPWSDPERAWRVILAVVERDPPMWVLSVLGAGPLEDLLRVRGLDFIDRVEQEALRNERFFNDVLARVYPIACHPEEVAERVKWLYGNTS